MPHELPKAYDPTRIEDRWAEFWVREKIFDSSHADASGAVFTMLLPPPNVTGRLHMGHMLNQTEMDILVRWHRMRGELALWVPGTDHAGIATQMMVERQLAKEGRQRLDLGRECFVKRVWAWKTEYGNAILAQMKRLGVSVDWSREYFTMDEGLSRSVREAFVRLYEQGLIYRGNYIVNWCPRCRTALSDLEVVHEEQQGKLYEIRYPVAGSSLAAPEYITVATTRPETMLGDVAVAVNPADERYTHLHGKHVRLPLVGREIPVILDDWANPEFGTGAVKITPAHDPNDFLVGQRHNLRGLTVMDETAHMNDEAGPYAGLNRYEARDRIVADLEAQNMIEAVREHTLSIGKCDRCKTIVEPRLSTQWFIRIQPLADKAIAAVEQGHIRFTPEQYSKTYFEWMRNIHDWCISRQLWWGHRIPAWHCANCGEITVSRDTPTQCAHCTSIEIAQEVDVLDTWFSSGLLPVCVFGWPENTPDLQKFYPTSLLVTGFDILFFWVARMIMLGCHFMLDIPIHDGSARTLRDAVPFREVYIHALVRDADRQKMSKTKGNVIDPIEIIGRFGTDAVRFTLAAMASPGTDIAFSEARTEGYRAFANKIWNAARFLLMQVERGKQAGIAVNMAQLAAALQPSPEAGIEALWIASRLHATTAAVNQVLEEYRFDEAAKLVYQFFWGEFCDWYLEAVKLRLNFMPEADPATAAITHSALTTLVAVFDAALRLLSPFMPFLTEELWHALYEDAAPQKSIALTRFPEASEIAHNPGVEEAFGILQQVIVEIRDLRKQAGVPDKEPVPVLLYSPERSIAEDAARNTALLSKLARVSEVHISDAPLTQAGRRSTAAFDLAIVYEHKIDMAAESTRLTKELEQFEREFSRAQGQLSNEGFLSKAPAKVVDGLRTRATELPVLIAKTRSALDALDGSGGETASR